MISSNKDLIQYMMKSGYLKSKEIINAFYKIDRSYFIQEKYNYEIYGNEAFPIGNGQTISQPSTVAFMLELLHVKKGDKVLDVGSGSGWTTALLSYLTGNTGSVLGLERIDELVEYGKKNIKKFHFHHSEIKKSIGEYGVPGEKYDKILVSAMIDTFPKELIKQLKVGGTLVLPIKGSVCKIKRTKKKDYSLQKYPGFLFVPLVK